MEKEMYNEIEDDRMVLKECVALGPSPNNTKECESLQVAHLRWNKITGLNRRHYANLILDGRVKRKRGRRGRA